MTADTRPHIDLGRLPTPGPHFVGRQAELARLDQAWEDPGTHVLIFRSDFPGAAEDLAEAMEIAERGSMRLHACDAHLESARLCRDQGDLTAARRHVARARELVEETGYERRRREVKWLEGALASQ